jgi:hypothetical protein
MENWISLKEREPKKGEKVIFVYLPIRQDETFIPNPMIGVWGERFTHNLFEAGLFIIGEENFWGNFWLPLMALPSYPSIITGGKGHQLDLFVDSPL